MRNLSIRTRILAGVVIVNLLGAIAIVAYLHQSFSKGLDTATEHTATQGVAAWDELKPAGAGVDPVSNPRKVSQILKKMKAITAADYGFLLAKEEVSKAEYVRAREALGLPDNWDERDKYALLATTDESVGDKMQFRAAPDSVPEAGKLVGVENGACSRTCHNGVTGQGDYWGVKWSTDSKTRGHVIFPVTGTSGKPIGIVYAIEDISRQADAARASMMQTLTVVALTLVAAAILIGGIVDALVLKRLARMTASVEDLSLRVAGGDFSARYEPDGTADEIGSFESFFAKLIDVMSKTLQNLSQGGPGKKGPS